MQFVRAIQEVDTTGIRPLVAIRDETADGEKARTVGLDDEEIMRALGREKTVGRRGRIVSLGEEEGAEGAVKEGKEKVKWDPVERAGRKVGRFVAVDTARD